MITTIGKRYCSVVSAVLLIITYLEIHTAFAAPLEEVVVTAQKREQSVNDVPITISAFTGNQLKELGVVDTRDLGKLVPGFKYANTGLNKPVFTLRGVGFNDFSQTASGTVGLYIDEFNLPFPVMSKGPLVDVQRIEVLKGPQGTLYGRNTTAGVVNFLSKTPTDNLEAGIKATYGRFKTHDVEAFVSGRVTDKLGMRFAGRQIKSSEGWQYSLTRGRDSEFGEQDKWSGRFTLLWDVTDSVDMTVGLEHWEDSGQPQAAQPIAINLQNPFLDPQSPFYPFLVGFAADPAVTGHPLVPFDTEDNRVADWPAPSEGATWRLRDKFSMARIRLNWHPTEMATVSYLLGIADFDSDNTTIPTSGLSVLNAEGINDVATNAWTQELRVSGAYNDVNYVLGIFSSADKVDQYWTGYIKTLSATFDGLIADLIDSKVKQDANSNAIFADVNWQFLPNWSVTAGARYTKESRDFQGCTADNADAYGESGAAFADLINIVSLLRGGGGGATRGSCVTLDHRTGNPGLVTKQLDENNLSGRLVVDWRPSDELMFYLSFSRGYKSGSFPISQASDSEQFRPVTQERLDALEAGGKLSLFSQSTQLNFAVFDYDYRDKQLQSFIFDNIFGALPQLDNAPKSRVKGGELDLRARVFNNLDLMLGGSYIDAKITEFVGINQDGKPEDFSGKEFNNAPRVMVSAGARYLWPLPWSDSVDLALAADYSYTDETNSALSGDERYALSSFYNVNCSIALLSRDDIWKVTAWGRNVTDEYQPISAGLISTDAISRYVQMPRTYGLTLEYNYF